MTSWRDEILKEFTPQVARLTLVADPDGLLLEEGVLKGIEDRGFELIPFEDHVAFRYAYESRYRSRWDRGELTDLVVVLHAATADLRSLPYDLLHPGRQLSFSLGKLFPNLSLRVLDALQRGDLDALYEAQTREHLDRPLGENQTKSFVLRHLFRIAPETIQNATGLLRFLLERHHKGLRMPLLLDQYLVAGLREQAAFKDWPLNEIVSDRDAFFGFVQERWPIFLDRLAGQGRAVHDPSVSYGMTFGGPEDLPFEHDDVRVYVDTLFLEGPLRPVPHPEAGRLASTWAAVGLRVDPATDGRRRWEGLLKTAEESVPDDGARHEEWQAFAGKWAQLIELRHDCEGAGLAESDERFRTLRDRIDARFLRWLRERYGTLHNQPPIPSVMLHHLPRLMMRRLEEFRNAKVALLLVDGLSLDQWLVARESLREQRPGLVLREETVFAWIPTLTMVSRQACFGGRPPLYFQSSIQTTDRESPAWSRLWADQGLAPTEVGYLKNLGEVADISAVEEVVSRPRVRAVGLVVDKVDRIMHGMELGTAGMHNQVRQWVQEGFLVRLLDMLAEHGFAAYLTADHGNIEAEGCGCPDEGAAAEYRGQRVRVYNDESLRRRVHEAFPEAVAWPTIGLPNGYLPLIAPGRRAFIRPGERVVGHGGITVEEVIVPLVCIERK
ncbi:MAG: BREX-3 system phosphatase PglZ [Planctomycetota bacterium]